MKKLHLIILLVSVAMSSLAQTVGEAFYIYRNDGGFNAFFRDEVDSIAYSNYDTDSIYFDEAVMQVVYTQDSIYRIPLAAIDSIGFLQPTPIYEDNVRELSGNILDYIISVDGMTITMRSDTPSKLIPNIGVQLAQLGFTSIFPNGFVGKVANISHEMNHVKIECDSISMDDVVKKYYGVYRLSVLGDDVATSRQNVESATLFDRIITCGNIPMHANLSWLEIWKDKEFLKSLEGLKFGAKGDFLIDIEPIFDVKVTYCKNDFIGCLPRYNARIISDITLTEEFQFMGEIQGEKKKPWKLPLGLEKLKDYPVLPGVTFYLDVGFKASGSGELGIGAIFRQSGRHILDVDFYPIPSNFIGPLSIIPITVVTHNVLNTKHDEDWIYVVGDFEAKFGTFLEFGFGFVNHHAAKIGAEFDLGIKVKGNVKFNTVDWLTAETNSDFYDGCKNESKLTIGAYFGSYGIISVFDERLKCQRGDDIEIFPQRFHKESFFLPSFDGVTLAQNNSNLSALVANANVRNKCVFPLNIGFTLFDSNGNKQKMEYYKDKYWTPETSYTNYSIPFSSFRSEEKYTVYPTVNLFGKDILASPSAELQTIHPVYLSDFKVTACRYMKDGFSNDNKTYDYKFEVTVNVGLGESYGVIDWGYIYQDPDGREKEISMKDFGIYPHMSIRDTRYAYFRNQPQSTITFYPYVKYNNSDQRFIGKSSEYPIEFIEDPYSSFCPDNHHPHMIDLGLPSGTKWACCNLEARTPKERGSYFAWGEIKPNKKSFTWDSYEWGNNKSNDDNGSIVDIGTDISGTIYDAAKARWGGSWQIPTKEQCEELLEHTTHSWISGTQGKKLTGVNGNSISIRATGHIEKETVYGYGDNRYTWLDDGYYWTSTLYDNPQVPDACSAAYYMRIDYTYRPEQWRFQALSRAFGLTIRPVSY